MKILFCRSNPVAPDPRVEKEARALTGAGYQVTALGWDRTGELPTHETGGDFEIFRLGIKSGYARGMGNLPQLLRWELGLFQWLVANRSRYDIIHACDFDTILPCLAAKYIFQKKLVYDIFDFYADHLRLVPGSIKSIIRKVDYWAIDRADAVIIVDDARVKQIHGTKPKHLAVIYNSPEEAGVAPCEAVFSKSAHLKITYVGLLQVERGLFEMLDVLSRHPDWELAIAGFGGDQEKIEQMAAAMPNVHWLGRVPYERAIQLSAEADLLFAIYDPTIPNHRYSSPNKIFESLMLGKPIIVAQDTNIDEIVAHHQNGAVIEYGNIPALEDALQHYATDETARQKAGVMARQAYRDVYSWDKMKQRLLALYKNIE